MYGYYNYIKLDISTILEKVSEIEIFAIVIKEPINDIGAKYLAPYRLDKSPKCFFKYCNGRLYFYDYALVFDKRVDCVGMIQKTFNLSYFDALKYINNYFNLGCKDFIIKNEVVPANKLKHTYIPHIFNKKPIVIDKAEKTKIEYIKKEYNLNDKAFWSKYEITKQNLIDDKVYSISHYRLLKKNNEYFTVYSKDLMYCYSDFTDGGVKIYRPYNKKSKWITNCGKDDVGGINNLINTSELLVITKSYKDYRVITNQGYNTIWFQNEGMIPNDTILRDLVNRFQNIIIWFDNDNTGINNGKAICNYISKFKSESQNIKLVYLPIELYDKNIKDASDFIASYGNKELNQIINKMFYE